METKIRPDIVLISIILSNPTPIVLRTTDEPSANMPMNGKIMIESMKEIIKL